ncbi:MAG: hypothetical protein NT094_00145, partial [Candidatus Staskawiczbacteria bacterium]|nr:hypothetical protein [Candidatus Staskawiczbacteria bacterium]
MIKKIAQSNKIFTQLNSFALQEFCETRLNRVKILILTFSKLKLFNGVHPIKYHKAVISPKAKSFNRVNQKKIGTVICLLIFLFLGLFYLPIKKVSSAGLEVVYPQIAGTTITADTKLPVFLKYLFDAGMFLGFFAVFMSLGIAGAMYLLSPAKPDWLADAKDRVGGAISGLLILALTYLIITTINPQLKFFGYNELPAPPPGPSAPTKALGVYLYGNASDCPDNPNNIVQPHTSSVPDLGLLRNKVSMVEIVQGNGEDQPYYISILYDHINFWGKCKWIPASPPGCQYANFFDPE